MAPPGRTEPSNPSGPSGEIYGGVYLSDEGVMAIALEVSKGGEEPGVKLVYDVVSYANEIGRAVGPGGGLYAFTQQVKASGASAFRKVLRKEVEGKPGLTHRKRVFLTGAFVWAMATLLYPEDRGGPSSPLHPTTSYSSRKGSRAPRSN